MAQQTSEEVSGRKGQWMLEVGTTSAGLRFNDIQTSGFISLSGGKFVTDQLALKISTRYFFTDSFSNSFGLSGGGKYYINNKFPVDLQLGFQSGGGYTSFLGSLDVGYAVPIAKNINFEPSIGFDFGGTTPSSGYLDFSFSLFF